MVTDLAERQQALTATQQLAASQQQQVRLQQQVEQLQADVAAAATQVCPEQVFHPIVL